MKTDKKSLLLSLGMRHFGEKGFRSVNISEITREAGISVGTFYNYFDSKEVYYAELLDSIEREGVRIVDRLISRLKSPMNKLKTVYRFVTLGLRRNELLRGILLRDQRYAYPGLQEREAILRPHIEGVLVDIVREGTWKGIFRTGLYRNAGALVIAIFDTIIYQIDQENAEELLHDMLVFLQRGLRRRLRLSPLAERRDRRMMRRLASEDTWP